MLLLGFQKMIAEFDKMKRYRFYVDYVPINIFDNKVCSIYNFCLNKHQIMLVNGLPEYRPNFKIIYASLTQITIYSIYYLKTFY